MKKPSNSLTPIMGAIIATTLSAGASASISSNPFTINDLPSGYMVQDKLADAKCGAGKCGAEESKTEEAKCGAGKCGAEETQTEEPKTQEAKCGAGKCGGEETPKQPEAKCGAGKCGA